jgi:hypothetical protein
VYVTRNNYLTVRPEVLRGSLVATTFFDKRNPNPIEKYLEYFDNYDSVCGSLISALESGADVDLNTIESLLIRADSIELWRRFAFQSDRNAYRALNLRPSWLLALAPALLETIPATALPKLLDAAETDDREPQRFTSHPLQIIEGWVRRAACGDCQVIIRRKAILQTVLDRLETDEPISPVITAVLKSIFTPTFEIGDQTPGDPNSFNITRGVLSDVELTKIAGFWRPILDALLPRKELHWPEIFSALDEWLFGGDFRIVVNRNHREIIRDAGKIAIQELLRHESAGDGVRAALLWRSRRIKARVSATKIDQDFLVLFPHDHRCANFDEERRAVRQNSRIEKCLTRLSKLSFDAFARRVIEFNEQFKFVAAFSANYFPFFLQLFSESTQQMSLYIAALVKAGAGADLLLPFLSHARAVNDPRWMSDAFALLSSAHTRSAGVEVMLRCPTSMPEEFESANVLNARLCINVIGTRVPCDRIPVFRLRRLLDDSCPELVEKVACEMWRYGDKQPIPHEIYSMWSIVVSRSAIDGYQLEKIFEFDSYVAFLWLQARLSNEARRGHNQSRAITFAGKVIDSQQRRCLLSLISTRPTDGVEIVRSLLSGDCQLYLEFFDKLRGLNLHLAPLTATPSHTWFALACVALDNGVSEDFVLSSAFQGLSSFHGQNSVEHERRSKIWREFVDDACPRVRELAVKGVAIALEAAKYEREREQEERLHDLYD